MKTRGLPSPEEQYALLLDGVLSEDDAPADLVSLKHLLQPLRSAELAVPDERFRAELRQRLEDHAAAPGPVQRLRDAMWDRTARWRHSLRVASASAMAASMLATAGVAAAAQHALPGELLYPVKEATESIRLALAGDLEATGRLHLVFAQERLEEVSEGANSLRSDLLVDTLGEMDEAGNRGSSDLLAVFALGGDAGLLDVVSAFLEDQRLGIQAIIDQLPVDVQPFAQQSIDALAEIQRQVDAAACGCDPDGDGPLPAPAPPQTDAQGQPLPDAPSAPGPCDCAPPEAPRPPREPSTPPPDDAAPDEPPVDDPPPADPPDDEPTPPPEPPRTDDRVVVPELPGPLDPVGDVLDDVIGDILDGAGVPAPVDGPPVEELPPPDLLPPIPGDDNRVGGTDEQA